MPRNLKTFVRTAQEKLESQGKTKEFRRKILAEWSKRYVIAHMAREAFDKGVPMDQGPVWSGSEKWKTDFWQRQWEWQKAYCEGEKARANFDGRDANPYHQAFMPFMTRLIELEYCWNRGFDNELL